MAARLKFVIQVIICSVFFVNVGTAIEVMRFVVGTPLLLEEFWVLFKLLPSVAFRTEGIVRASAIFVVGNPRGVGPLRTHLAVIPEDPQRTSEILPIVSIDAFRLVMGVSEGTHDCFVELCVELLLAL